MKKSKLFSSGFLKLTAVLVLSFAAFSSCSKSNRPVRASVKNQSNNISPNTSNSANQQAASQNANYNIATISVPEQTTAGYQVKVELKTPSGEYLPLTTKHENGTNLIEGQYNDSQRGLVVYVQANCSANQCDKYTMLVTVYRNNQPVYQTFAISYKDDCAFNVISASSSFGSFYQNISTAEAQNSNVLPAGDIDRCPVQ